MARYLQEHPECVAGKHVLDFGAGAGIVAIAAAKAGAASVTAMDIDPNARAAIALNAAANGVHVLVAEIATRPPSGIDIVLAGDVFYDPEPAEAAEAFLDLCVNAGLSVLVGDPGRHSLPLHRLHAVAEYRVADFGTSRSGASVPATVYTFERVEADGNLHHLQVGLSHSTGLEPVKNGE